MTVPAPFVTVMAITGLALGSFLNVVVYRVPREQSVVSPPSSCPSCHNRLKAWHNVPVVSWLVLRGRCAFCAAPISARYPLVEFATAALFALMTMRFGLSPQLPAYLFLAAAGLVLALIDLDVRRLPGSVVVPSYVVAVLLLMPAGAASGDWQPAVRALVGLAALTGVYFTLAIAFPTSVSMSDVQLAGLLGLYLGWLSWTALAIGAIGGLVLGTLGRLAFGALRQHQLAFATGPCLVVATGTALFITVPLASWYGALVGAT